VSVQKKSLIGDRSIVKKAMIASQSAKSYEGTGDSKGLQAAALKGKTLKASTLRGSTFKAASMKKR